MTMHLSNMRSELFKGNWDPSKSAILSSEESLSFGLSFDGGIRIFQDTVNITELFKFDDIILFPVITERCYIFKTHLTVQVPSTDSGKIDVLLFSGTAVQDDYSARFQFECYSNRRMVHIYQYRPREITDCSQGGYIGLICRDVLDSMPINDGVFEVTVFYTLDGGCKH